VGSAIIAGLIGGVVVDAFLSLVMHTSVIGIWQFVASTIVGKVAFSSPEYAALGFVVHFVTSIVWAVLYLYVFGALGQLKNWIVGAIVWGIVVDALMNALLAVKTGSAYLPGVEGGLVAHIVFYALPVALYLARSVRRTA
jgi:hypothetical protein